MSKYLILLISTIFLFSCNEPENNHNPNNNTNELIKTIKLKNRQDTIDYSIGIIIGKQMKEYGIYDFNKDILLKAIQDVLTENEQNLPIHPDVAKNIVSLYVKQTTMEKIAYDVDANDVFLQKNAEKAGIHVLQSGIQYKEIIKGTGKIPTEKDNVTIHYTGKLIDGDIFVTTEGRNPVSFDISSALKGWQEVLKIMPVGSEWVVYLPPQYAFGQKGSKNVPPNSVVIYNIKLLSIN